MQIGSFIKVFIIPEFRALTSNKWKLLLLLVVIITSFWGIGFSSAIQFYLKKKMDNPFVRFITVTVTREANLENLTKDLVKSENQKHYRFNNYTKIYTSIPNFQSTSIKQPDAYIRAVDKQDSLFHFLFNESDIMISRSPVDITNNETSWGIIVTEDYLRKLGYNDLNVSYINYIKPDSVDQIVPLPVAAVVKQLPDYLNGIVSDKLLMAINGGFEDNPLDLSIHKSELCFFIATESVDLLKEKIKSEYSDDIEFLENECQVNGLRCLLQTENPEYELEQIKTKFKNDSIIRTYNFNDRVMPQIYLGDPSFLSIPFNSLDSIPSFQKYIEENHNHVRIDMNTVEAKNNFNFFDKISNLLSVLLTIFGSVLLITITLNTVLNHIDQNKTNLGTLKAFGMSNLSVTLVYTSISAMLIFIITSIGYFTSFLLGNLIANIVASIKGMAVDPGTDLFILHIDGFLIFNFLILPVITVSVFIYFKLFNKTPGDLIYERD